MTIANINRSAVFTPSTRDAYEQLAKILRHVDKVILRYALDIRPTPSIRTLSGHGVNYQLNDNPRCLLIYESGWIRSCSGRRTYSKLFLLPDTRWLVQSQETGYPSEEPRVQIYEDIFSLLPVLEEIEFHGFVAARSIRRLLKVTRPKSKWSESWQELCFQIDQSY